ncbi:Protein fam50a [Perkinsus olseni]|uniref:Protein fam50a n=1 Tax=Perkinsus olseni TaxID=32597 RepID=A0A7J6PDF5_PEROL|nr:Protein fam50a [Perkinsus olseni]
MLYDSADWHIRSVLPSKLSLSVSMIRPMCIRPLYQFEVDDGGLGIGDIRATKNRSNPGKIVDRKWYEENKHVFPANKWEPYDPTKSASAESKAKLQSLT